MTSPVPSKDHWLDNAKELYTESEISDTRSVLDVICVFTAYPVFWSLYEQLLCHVGSDLPQGSKSTLQATLMNGRVDYLDWTIKPDQMHAIEPFLALMFLVLFDVVLYPLLAMVGVRKPLQKLTVSGILAIIAFVRTAILQIKITGNTTEIPLGQGCINIYNGFDCNVFVRSESLNIHDHIDPLEVFNVSRTVETRNTTENVAEISFSFDTECNFVPEKYKFKTTVVITEGEAPTNLKSFISAVSLLTTALGNMLVVIISTISIKNQVHEYLLYCGLMLADTLLLAYFSVVYRNKNTDMTDVMALN